MRNERFGFRGEYGRKAQKNWWKGTTRSGACGLIWLNTGKMLFHEVHGMLCLLSLFYGCTDLKILILARPLVDEFAQFGLL